MTRQRVAEDQKGSGGTPECAVLAAPALAELILKQAPLLPVSAPRTGKMKRRSRVSRVQDGAHGPTILVGIASVWEKIGRLRWGRMGLAAKDEKERERAHAGGGDRRKQG